MGTKELLKKYLYLAGALFVFLLFTYISYKTPLAGDDWGYALNGRIENPFVMAYNFYFSWSGRYFSELYGFILCNNKWLWNVLNPVLFTIIFVFLYKISGVKNNKVLAVSIIILLILSVDNNLRMETYSWLMGTTYVIPLALSLGYYLISFKYLENKFNKVLFVILSNIALFVIGLMMENIAAAMIVGTVSLAVYSYLKKKDLFIFFIINVCVSLISFAILRLSPGASFRLLRDSADWATLSIFEKIAAGYPDFIKITFLSAKYLITALSLSIIGLVICNKKETLSKKIMIVLFEIIAILIVAESFMAVNLIFNYLYWPLYVAMLLYVLFRYIGDESKKYIAILMLFVGGTSALSMIMSPIYGYRSSIYVVFYLIPVILIINDGWLTNKHFEVVLTACLLVLIMNKTDYYYKVYKDVGRRNIEREYILNYYREHPEDEEIWLERYPLNSIHGADIDPGDTYHFETFKEYYNLPQDENKIYFYLSE